MAEEIVGKSAGWKGSAEEYTRNEGSVGKKRIVFIGASYKFVHKVLRDMLLVGGFQDCELVVHDIEDLAGLFSEGNRVSRVCDFRRTASVFRCLGRQPPLKRPPREREMSRGVFGGEARYAEGIRAARRHEILGRYIPLLYGDDVAL